MKIKMSELRQIIREEIINENLGLKNGTKILYVNSKGKLVPGKIKVEVGDNQYQIQDDKDGNTQVLRSGKKAKQGVRFQVNESLVVDISKIK